MNDSSKESGQAILETLLALGLLLLLAMSILQLALIIFVQIQTDHHGFVIVREATIRNLETWEISNLYRKQLRSSFIKPSQGLLELEQRNIDKVPHLRLKITQGYPTLPFMNFLLQAFFQGMPTIFEKELWQQKKWPIKSEVILPLPQHLSPYATQQIKI